MRIPIVAKVRNSVSPFALLLTLMVALRLLIALLIMLDVVPLPPDMRSGWYLHHGGDQNLMFRLARGLVDGQPTREVTGLGTSLVMALFTALTDAQEYRAIVVPMVLFNGFLLGGLSVAVLGLLARRTTRSDGVAVIAALIWALAPLIAYLMYLPSPRWLGFYVPMIGWLNGLSDPPAAFFLLLSAMLLARQINRAATPRSAWLVIGLSLGAMVVFRIHLLFALVFLMAYALIAHGWRAVAWIGLGMLIAYLPQALYNTLIYSMPFTTGYIAYSIIETATPTAADVAENLPFHPRYLTSFAARNPAALIALAVTSLIAGVWLWRRHGWRSAALLIGAPLAYLLPMLAAWPFATNPVRFALPAIPFLAAIMVTALAPLSRIRLASASAKPARADQHQNRAGSSPQP